MSQVDPETARRRALLLALFCGAAASPAPALAVRAVVVKTKGVAAYDLALRGFQRAFDGEVTVREIGKKEGVSTALADEIRRLEPDVVVGVGTRAAVSLKERLPDLPLVFAMVLSPEKRGLGGRKVSGVSLEISPALQLKLFKKILPTMSRIGVIYDPAKSGPLVDVAEKAARVQGVELHTEPVARSAEVGAALERLLPRIDALWLLPDASVVTRETFKQMLIRTHDAKVPLLAFSEPFVKAGALAAVAPDYEAIGAAAARLAERAARQGGSGSPVIEDPPARLVVNRKAAEHLGLEPDTSTVEGVKYIETQTRKR